MGKSIISAEHLRQASSAYHELYNDNGLQVHAIASGRFEVKCGSTHTYARSLQEVASKVNSLDLHAFPSSGEEVISSIQAKLGSVYRLEICASKGSDHDVVHEIEGSKESILDQVIGTVDVNVPDMVPGRRYAVSKNMYGGDFAMIVPMNSIDAFSLSSEFGVPELYEEQPFKRGDVLYGICPLSKEVVTVLVDEAYPNGSFKGKDNKIWKDSDIGLYQLTLGEEATTEDFHEPDESFFDSDDVPTYNPVGDCAETAPMIGNIGNYDLIASAAANVVYDFMKTASKYAFIERSSLNKISVSSINEDGFATEGGVEFNVRIASPYYKRSSQITIPLVIQGGNVDLGREFIVSTGAKVPLTVEGLAAHLGSLSDKDFDNRGAYVVSSTLKADADIDAGIAEASVEKTAASEDVEAAFWSVVDQAGEDAAKAEEIIAADYLDMVKDFEGVYSKYSGQLYDALDPVITGVSDDGFTDFIAAVIAKGKAVVEEVLANPIIVEQDEERFGGKGFKKGNELFGYAMNDYIYDKHRANTPEKHNNFFETINEIKADTKNTPKIVRKNFPKDEASFISIFYDTYYHPILQAIHKSDQAGELEELKQKYEGTGPYGLGDTDIVFHILTQGKEYAEQVLADPSVLNNDSLEGIENYTDKSKAFSDGLAGGTYKDDYEEDKDTFASKKTAGWSVNVGNMGNIEEDSEEDALAVFEEYVNQSKLGYGRVGGEAVTLMEDGEIIDEYLGELGDYDSWMELAKQDNDQILAYEEYVEEETKKGEEPVSLDEFLSVNYDNLSGGVEASKKTAAGEAIIYSIYATVMEDTIDQGADPSTIQDKGRLANGATRSVDEFFKTLEIATGIAKEDWAAWGDGIILATIQEDGNGSIVEDQAELQRLSDAGELYLADYTVQIELGNDTEPDQEKLSQVLGISMEDGVVSVPEEVMEEGAVMSSKKTAAGEAIIYSIYATVMEDTIDQGADPSTIQDKGRLANGATRSVDEFFKTLEIATGIAKEDWAAWGDGIILATIQEDGNGSIVEDQAELQRLSDAGELYLADYTVQIELGNDTEPDQEKLSQVLGISMEDGVVSVPEEVMEEGAVMSSKKTASDGATLEPTTQSHTDDITTQSGSPAVSSDAPVDPKTKESHDEDLTGDASEPGAGGQAVTAGADEMGSGDNIMSDDQIADSYEDYVIEEASFKEGSDASGYISLVFPGDTAQGDNSIVTGFIIYDSGKVAFDDWFPEEVYFEISNYIKDVLKDSGKVMNVSQADVQEALKGLGYTDASKKTASDDKVLLQYDEYETVKQEVDYIIDEAPIEDYTDLWDDIDVVDAKDKTVGRDAPEFRKLVREQYEDKVWDYVSQDTDLHTFQWEYFESALDELLTERGKEFNNIWEVSAKNMGWRNQSGEAIKEIDTTKDLLNMLPETDMTITITDDDGTSFDVVVHHHDSPTGETYSFSPAKPIADGTTVKYNEAEYVINQSEFDPDYGGFIYYLDSADGSEYTSDGVTDDEFEVITEANEVVEDGAVLSSKKTATKVDYQDDEEISNWMLNNWAMESMDEDEIGAVDYETVILPTLKEKLEDAFEDLSSKYEMADPTGEEVEHQSRDGFIAFTDGGYDINSMTLVSSLQGSGMGFSNEEATKELARLEEGNYQYALDTFKEKYPEVVAELGEDKINYNDLYEADKVDLAEELDELQNDSENDSVIIGIKAYYYEPANSKNDNPGEQSIFIKLTVNFESPYHRESNDIYLESEEFSFATEEELESKLDAFLSKV